MQRADDGPDLRMPRPVGRYADGLDGGGARALYQQVTGHLLALAEGLRVRVAPRLLDGNSASALAGAAHALLALRPAVRGPLTDLTTALLDTGRLAGTGVLTGPGLAFRRRSCCLYYRAPDGSSAVTGNDHRAGVD
nr:(2Fe-2S)-binding protein [Streptomyces sp. NA03103]